jgi:hypothetical protein
MRTRLTRRIPVLTATGVLVAFFISCFLIGCRAQAGVASAGARQNPDSIRARQMPNVPPFPPDTVSQDVWRNRGPYDPMARDIVLVAFKAGTSIDKKRMAIAAISGNVIGGSRTFLGEGAFYVVRIPDAGAQYLETLSNVKRRLLTYDFVAYVTYYIETSPGSGS